MCQTFGDLCAEFLAWAQKCLKPSTVNVYRHYFRRWIELHGDLPLDDIFPRHLEEFAKTWHDCQAIKRLFSWATNSAGFANCDRLRKVKGPRKGYRRRILAPREAIRILRAVPSDLRRLLLAYRETFARPQELRLATWEDLKPDDPALTIEQALELSRVSIVLYDFKDAGRRQDGERPRIILLSPRACRLLMRLLSRHRNPRGAIFRTARGRGWTANALRCRFRRLRVKLGIKRDKRGETIVPYTFRHSGATIAAAHGVRDRLLADILGHIETKTTARYCHLQTEHLRAAMSKIWGQ